MSMFSFNTERPKKYAPGLSACGSCQSNKHKNCRLRLDGTLCSCNCDIAVFNREELRTFENIAQEAGEPTPSIIDVLPFIKRSSDRWTKLVTTSNKRRYAKSGRMLDRHLNN